MACLPILVAPHPILKRKADLVTLIDADLVRLMDDMLETMYDAPGLGLAAPQIGVSKRVIVMDTARTEEDRNPIRMINPEITWASDEMKSYEEGCLSVPEHYAEVLRPQAVRARFMDALGKTLEINADGLLAVVVQHEIDHLNGVLFVDHLSSLKRNMILRKLTKARKDEEE